MRSGPSSLAHSTEWRSASASTISVSRPSCPVLPAIAMNSSGESGPYVGCGQRTSASAPTRAPLSRATFGWKWTSSSPRSRARRRSEARPMRRRLSDSSPEW